MKQAYWGSTHVAFFTSFSHQIGETVSGGCIDAAPYYQGFIP